MFKIGDKVIFKTWEQLEHEFGIEDCSGYIDCKCYFTPEMKHLCGKVFTISYINSIGNIEGHNSGYYVSADMIKHYNKYKRL